MEHKRILFALMLGCSFMGVTSTVVAKMDHKSLTQQESAENQFTFKENESVLYFGGLQTEAIRLAKRIPNGLVAQLQVIEDASYASKPANLKSESEISSNQTFDQILVEESFVQNTRQKSLLTELSQKLNHQGKMTLAIPDYKGGAVSRALSETWVELEELVFSSPVQVIYSAKHYRAMLETIGLKVNDQSFTQRSQQFSSKESFASWLQHHWPYYKQVHDNDKPMFLTTFVDHYLQVTNQSPTGPIAWQQDFLEIHASKELA